LVLWQAGQGSMSFPSNKEIWNIPTFIDKDQRQKSIRSANKKGASERLSSWGF